eukprot:TRINITY_DN502_c0_g2_i1.p1 TRINITY_DN502_c0_g2~~TRINITY_DN502_c0_g2_i1.p1  ORF type:complete len:606 (+),score=122.96 TRINITY_DN502_c0_g2_i1:179-1996(+)
MMRLRLLPVLLLMLAVHSSADGDALSVESLAKYEVDPSAPCGTRCQIKRALGAWGDMLQVKVGSLVSRYSRMSVDHKAIKALRSASLGFQKRVDAAERALTRVDSPRLRQAFAQLKQVDNRAKTQVSKIHAQGSNVNRETALNAAKLIDAERKALNVYERRAADESSMRSLAASVRRLAAKTTALAAQKLVLATPSLSTDVGRLVKACSQTQTQIDKTEMSGTSGSHKMRQELESRVESLWRSFHQHYKRTKGQFALNQLQHEVALVSKRKATIDATFDPNQAGRQAVLHEVIAKADHTVKTEMHGFTPSGTAHDEHKMARVRTLLREERQNMERYEQLDTKLHLSSQISEKVKKLQKKSQDLENPTQALEEKLRTLKKGAKELHRNVASLTHPKQVQTQSAAELVSNIDQLLEKSEAKQVKQQKQMSTMKSQNKKLKRGLAEAERELEHVNVASNAMEQTLDEKKGTDLGEPNTDADSVSSLKGDIDGFLDAASSTDESNPYLLESALTSTLLDPVDLVELSESTSTAIPFLTASESSNDFNQQKVPVKQVKPRQVRVLAQPKPAHHDTEDQSSRDSNDDFVQALRMAMARTNSRHMHDPSDPE